MERAAILAIIVVIGAVIALFVPRLARILGWLVLVATLGGSL